MENASKALIIAGAILLSILIIAIGMYIYNSSTSTINSAITQISQQDKNAFNNQFSMYEGKQVGTNVKSLIQLLSNSANENREEETKLPDLAYQAKSATDTQEDVFSNVADPNITGFLTSPDTGLIDGVIVEYEEGSLANSGDYEAVITPDGRP